MSTDDKKKNQSDVDGLAELLNAFGGYNEDGVSDEAEAVSEMENYTSEDMEIELPETPEAAAEPEMPSEDAPDATDTSVSDGSEEDKESITDTPAPKNKKKKKKKSVKSASPSEDITASSDSADTPSDDEPAADVSVKKEDLTKAKKDDSPKSEKKTNVKPDKSAKKDKKKNKSDLKPQTENHEKKTDASPVRLVTVLTLICASVALLLASVNHFTEAKIAENNELAMLQSIREIFDESVQAEEIAIPDGSGLTSAYLVIKDGGVCGYSAATAPAGFGGPINLMVGVDSGGYVVGVEVVSMSETPGLGTKTGRDDFLSLFNGKSGEITVDAISGATISSKAVMSGVNSVTANLLDLAGLAAERGMTVIPYAKGDTVSETAVPETTASIAEPVDTAAVPEVPETAAPPETEGLPVAPEVSKTDAPPENIVANPSNESPGIAAEYTEVTAEFETLTTEPESSDLTDTAEPGAETALESAAEG